VIRGAREESDKDSPGFTGPYARKEEKKIKNSEQEKIPGNDTMIT